MAAATRTKALVALGMLDIARQVATAWSAKQRAERERAGLLTAIRADARQLAHDAREHLPSPTQLNPFRHEPTAAERIRTWAPVALVIAASTAAIIIVARVITHRDAQLSPERAASDSRMIGAVRASSHAIDEGVSKVVEGGSAVATGTAAAVAAGSTAIRQAAVTRVKDEVDERVVQPAKRKAITWSALGVLGLTAYVIVIAAAVQLLVGWLA